MFYNMDIDGAAISVAGLRKSYGRIDALRGLDLEFPRGVITGFVGPNGAGKTTTFRALLGLTRVEEGEIRILGMNVPSELPTITKRVGAIIEEPGIIKAHSGRVNMTIAADTLGFGHDRIDELLHFVGLTGDADRKVDRYSKGMRQRLALASAMIGDPDLLLLDEPLDGLDPAGQRAFRSRLRGLADEGKTIVVSSHDLGDIEALADHVVVISRGRRVVQGPIAELLDGGGTRVVIDEVGRAMRILEEAGLDARSDTTSVVVASDDAPAIIRVLAAAGVYPREVRPERTTLESVFLGITEEYGS